MAASSLTETTCTKTTLKKNILKVRYTTPAQHGSGEKNFCLSKDSKKTEPSKNGKNNLPDHSGNLDCKKKGRENFSSRNGALKTSRPMHIADRNKLINKLNLRKASLYRAAGLSSEDRDTEIARINRALQKL